MPEKLTVLEIHLHDLTFGPSEAPREEETDRTSGERTSDADPVPDSVGFAKPMLALVALVAVAVGVRQLLSSRP